MLWCCWLGGRKGIRPVRTELSWKIAIKWMLFVVVVGAEPPKVLRWYPLNAVDSIMQRWITVARWPFSIHNEAPLLFDLLPHFDIVMQLCQPQSGLADHSLNVGRLLRRQKQTTIRRLWVKRGWVVLLAAVPVLSCHTVVHVVDDRAPLYLILQSVIICHQQIDSIQFKNESPTPNFGLVSI